MRLTKFIRRSFFIRRAVDGRPDRMLKNTPQKVLEFINIEIIIKSNNVSQ